LNDGSYTAAFTVTPYSTFIDVNQAVVVESASSPPPWLSRIILLSKDVGPFYANIEGLNINKFSVDIVFPKGFYNSNDSGTLTNSSATLKIEWRVFGDPTFTLAENVTFTAAKNEAQRYTRTYDLPGGTDGLIEVKVTRTSETANSSREVNESHWAGLRGFIIAPTSFPPHYDGPTIISNEHYQYPDRTVLAVKVRATGQLSEAMSKQFNGIFQRLIPTWDGTSWTVPVATSSIPWIFADVITNTQYGIGRPYSAINVDELAILDATYAERGDEFNYYFDQDGTIYDTLATIARVGRATPIFDGRTFSMIRDEPRVIRAGIFTDQNMVKDSVNVAFDFIGSESAKGVLISYWDENSYVIKTILCGEDVNTTNLSLAGCTSRQQAWNEGNYMVNVNKYRRVNVSFGTEMDGFIPRNGDLVTVQAEWMDWGQSAQVLSVDGLSLTINQNLDWSGAGFAAILRDVDGTPSASIACSRGASDNIVVLESLPSFDIQTDGTQERTQIAMGNSVSLPMDVIVNSINAEDEFHTTIQSSVEDDRVYTDPGPAPVEYPSG
jgi:predicted phage tail protein